MMNPLHIHSATNAAASTAPMGVTLFAGAVAALICVLLGRPLMQLLRHYHIGKIIRSEEPGSNQAKMGTLTMGGVLFVGVTVALIGLMYTYTRLAARISLDFGGVVLVGRSIFIPVLVLLGFAVLGAIDDYMGVRGVRRGEGMRGRSKAALQLVIAIIAALVMSGLFNITTVAIPGMPFGVDLGILWVPVAVVIIMGMANAVNFADGADGLAALNSLVAYVAYGIIAYLQGQAFITMFCMVLAGSLLGFLWFNVHPAVLFMGDTGSEALGGALGVVALMTGQWLLLPMLAVVPVAELFSVILQVGYFKLTKGKRLFKLTPFHYHFVLSGWSETQMVHRFWLMNILYAMAGVGLAVLGNPFVVR